MRSHPVNRLVLAANPEFGVANPTQEDIFRLIEAFTARAAQARLAAAAVSPVPSSFSEAASGSQPQPTAPAPLLMSRRVPEPQAAPETPSDPQGCPDESASAGWPSVYTLGSKAWDSCAVL